MSARVLWRVEPGTVTMHGYVVDVWHVQRVTPVGWVTVSTHADPTCADRAIDVELFAGGAR